MGRLAKIKRELIQEANRELDEDREIKTKSSEKIFCCSKKSRGGCCICVYTDTYKYVSDTSHLEWPCCCAGNMNRRSCCGGNVGDLKTRVVNSLPSAGTSYA